MNDEISRRLRGAAEAYRPDRDRMLARVHRGMEMAAGTGVVSTRAASVQRSGIARSWTRATFAGLAVSGALATAGLAVAAIVHTAPPPDPGTIPTAGPPSATSTPSASTTTAPVEPPAQGQTQPERSSTSSPPPATDPAPLTGKPVSDGPLSSVGLIDLQTHPNWAQSRLELKTTVPLSSLSVELRVVQTGEVRTTGQWQTMAGDDFTVTVQEVDGAVVYRWELKPGRTVPEGVHAFAGQYNHAVGKRDARADAYVVRSGTFTVRGGFTSE
ncbi:hypothetical protein [Lentzea sp. NPDC051838]|uniref:hypothetical protein n=1 Tax=Lentzea sp. NPDC051838 TaxID=3154849 RepID=UPI00341F362B